ncbi:hypothetical protein, partial [Thiolapillus sp.]|uniref:hypothetical protein n=1 Tax=Thiolapillus sp. TaxID=2017437 RepID=UPI003AF4F5F0
DFSYAYFVSPLRYRTPDKQCGPGRYRGLTAFASLSMAVSDCIDCRSTDEICRMRQCNPIKIYANHGKSSLAGNLVNKIAEIVQILDGRMDPP